MLTNFQLSKLSDIVVNDIGRLFEQFKIPYYSGQSRIYTTCMIHDSDKFNSLNIYIGGYQVPFVWKCRSHHCEKTFKKTVIGFTRALLSSANGWVSPEDKDKEVSFNQTIRFLCDLYKVNLSNIKENVGEVDKNRFVYMANRSKLREEPKVKTKVGVSREKVRELLKIPAEYYLKRGYSPEIIDKYDIGLCDTKGKDMYGRIVIPIYDETGQFMVGCTARSIFEKCEKCKGHHEDGPCPVNINKYSKWRHNFESRHHLYNYWFAYPTIKQTSSALLVESPGNVLKLEMAGIHNSLAMFGNSLKTEQKFLLEKAGVMDLTILLDNDPAGELGREMIEKECGMYYNLRFIDLPSGVNDVGEMNIKDIKELLCLTTS